MLRWCGCGRDTASSAASPSEGEKSNDGLFKRMWSRYLRLRQSPMSSLFVVCVAIFTDMLVYGMVVPIFVPEILQITTVEVLNSLLPHLSVISISLAPVGIDRCTLCYVRWWALDCYPDLWCLGRQVRSSFLYQYCVRFNL